MQKFYNIILIITVLLFCQFNIIGQNLVTNGDFQLGDSDWTKGTGWTIIDSGGNNWIAHSDGTGSFAMLRQNVSVQQDVVYKITFDMLNRDSGNLRPFINGGNTVGATFSSNGTHTVYLTSTATEISFFGFQSLEFYDGDIDNVLIEVTSINVTSPNGGESWQAGSSQTITWTDNIDDNVKIELFRSGTFNSPIVAATESDGSYTWIVPNSASTDYTIGISSVSNSEINDFSDQSFSISADFEVNLLVSDNCTNGQNLIFGTNDNATVCFDPLYDLYAPPPAPQGAFDTRFVSCSEGFIKDIRATNLDEVMIWDVEYQAASGCDNVSFSWDPEQLPEQGNFTLIDFATEGSLVQVDMRKNSSYADVQDLGHLQILFNYSVIVSTDILDGFNIVSLPLEVEDCHYKTLYPNAIDGSLFGFNGSYFGTDFIMLEEGYWLRFGATEVVDIEGIPISTMDLDLTSGWNMIGGPACDFPFTSVIDAGGIIIPGTLNGFNGAYFAADTCKQGLGYWIRTNASGTITLDCSAAGNLQKGGNEDPFLVDLTEFNSVAIEDYKSNEQTLYFGAGLDETVSKESFSLPPLPPSGLFDARISGGYRLSESEEILIEIQSENYPLKVKMAGEYAGNTYGYLIKEFAGNAEVRERKIADGMEIVIDNSNVNLLKILKGSIIPASFVLEQNYPNPFNPATKIKYGLPVKGDVILKVFNTIGEEIATLVNEEKPAGTYEVNFDGTNIASGIYFYSLKAKNLETGIGEVFVETKKMILLK